MQQQQQQQQQQLTNTPISQHEHSGNITINIDDDNDDFSPSRSSFPPPHSPRQPRKQKGQGSATNTFNSMASLDLIDWFAQTRVGRVVMAVARLGMRSLGLVLVAFALCAFSLITVFWFWVMIPMLSGDHSTIKFVVHFAVGVYLSVSLLFHYIQCIRTDAGTPPEHWKEEAKQNESFMMDIQQQQQQQQRWSKYCKRCDEPKPPRTHHCHMCNRCVMRMDHHCPWINNCVGYKNHRYFISFLSYLWLAAVYISLHGALITAEWIWYDKQVFNRYAVYISFLFLLSFSMAVVMAGFIGWHLYLISTNQTTIEFQFNKLQVLQSWGERSSLIVNEYDVGLWKNIQQIFGTSLLRCVLPSAHSPPLDGTHWPTISGLRVHKHNLEMA